MNTNQSKIFQFIQQYKIYILLLLPIFIFLIAILVTLPSGSQTINNTNESTNSTKTTTNNGSAPQNVSRTSTTVIPTATAGEGTDADTEIDFYADSDAQREVLDNGNIKYTTTSPTSGRPNVAQVKSDGSGVVFERSVIDLSGAPIFLNDYLSVYGQPQQVREDHSYYGLNAVVYIYASEGLAYVVSKPTGRILELHTFVPMSVNNYIQLHNEHL